MERRHEYSETVIKENRRDAEPQRISCCFSLRLCGSALESYFLSNFNETELMQ
jgi:hypothetical protein